MLVLSAIFAAAAVWTKSEGLPFVLIPWMLLVAVVSWKNAMIKQSCLPLLTAACLALPWPIFAQLKGLGLTPHSSDTQFGFEPAGLKEILPALFSRGSFGITWYAIGFGLVLAAWLIVRRDLRLKREHLPTLVWGLAVFCQVLLIYLFTPNVRFLLNAESFYRQMLLPAAMLIVSLALMFAGNTSYESEPMIIKATESS